MAVSKKIIDTINGQHPSRTIGFETLYQGLMEQVEQRFITKITKNDLELFNYSSITMFEQNWNIYTLIARGLILSPQNKKIIATPFPKFFNYGEIELWEADKHDGEIIALEKLDGSLGIVYHHDDEWHCATRGSFNSDQAVWGKNWLHNNIDTTQLKIGHTYLFEIIYPENRIVVSYQYQGMVLLSAYSDNGFEYDIDSLRALKEHLKIKKATQYPFKNLDDFVKKAESIDKNNEGWVIRFPNGHRIKIKGSKYCKIHRLISNVTPLGVWNNLINMDDIDAIRKDLPEEHLQDFDAIKNILDNSIATLVEKLNTTAKETKYMSDKDVGLSLGKGHWPDGTQLTEEEKKFIFLARKFDLEKELRTKGKISLSLYKYIKPKANILKNYIPSKTINRFQNESIKG